MTMMGWICPICGTAKSPQIESCCTASPPQQPTASAATTTASLEVAGKKVVSSKGFSTRNRYNYQDKDFLNFWEAYPLRKGKAAAFRKWQVAIAAGVAPQLIIDAALRYRNDPNRDPAFTKWPEGWLAAGRWDDDPEPPRAASIRHDDRAAAILREAISEQAAG